MVGAKFGLITAALLISITLLVPARATFASTQTKPQYRIADEEKSYKKNDHRERDRDRPALRDRDMGEHRDFDQPYPEGGWQNWREWNERREQDRKFSDMDRADRDLDQGRNWREGWQFRDHDWYYRDYK